MTTISIGDAIGEGFGLIRRRPLVILAWGALHVGWSFATTALMWPSLAGFTQNMRNIRAGQAASPATAMANLAPMMQMEGQFLLVGLVSAVMAWLMEKPLRPYLEISHD